MKRKWFPANLTKGLPDILDALFVGDQDHHGWVFMDANDMGRACVDALFPGVCIAWRAPCGDIVPAHWHGFEINVPDVVAGLPETKLPLEIIGGADLSKANPDALALLLAFGVVRQGGCAAIIRNGGLEIFQLDDHARN
jgi:hypothetical protein